MSNRIEATGGRLHIAEENLESLRRRVEKESKTEIWWADPVTYGDCELGCKLVQYYEVSK